MSEQPRIVAFCCEHSGVKAADAAGLPKGVRCVPVRCSGNVEAVDVLTALRDGADGVLVLGCHEGSCRHIRGNDRAAKRLKYVADILDEIGIGGTRARFETIAPVQPTRFAEIVAEMAEQLGQLGPHQGKVPR